MAVRSSMAALIAQTRLLINDPSGGSPIFADQDIQDVLDQTRRNARYLELAPSPTYSGSTLLYLDYYADLGWWEDDTTFWQYLTVSTTPTTSEPIVGHWSWAATLLPPVYLIGKTYDLYRGAADLLERWAAKWALSYDFSSDGQSFHRSQASLQLRATAKEYRKKQRASVISLTRGDLNGTTGSARDGLGPMPIDYMASGDGR